MRLSLLLAGLVLSGVLASAQENIPKVEVGASYSFVRTNSERHFNENGGSGYIEYNLNRSLGLVADLGGYTNGSNRFQSFSYLFGPRFNLRMGRFTPYVQSLFGGVYAWSNPPVGSTFVSTTQNGFATAAGAGLDIEITHHIAIKPLQVEYVMSQLPTFATNARDVQNNLRYSAGIVLRLGSK
jgi:hypothetical protein